jgi:dimeric dUTPase (all-alpha-NTP-PPase superfamily)
LKKINVLFDMQQQLDVRIKEEKGLVGQDLFDELCTAALVELAEFLNETKVFKYWSNKTADREKTLEELVDFLHFLLSIGNHLGLRHRFSRDLPIKLEWGKKDIQLEYMRMCGQLAQLNQSAYDTTYELLTWRFLRLMMMLEFTWDDVLEAYFIKHKTNHLRLSSGY